VGPENLHFKLVTVVILRQGPQTPLRDIGTRGREAHSTGKSQGWFVEGNES
jgi:hypothetical protein